MGHRHGPGHTAVPLGLRVTKLTRLEKLGPCAGGEQERLGQSPDTQRHFILKG